MTNVVKRGRLILLAGICQYIAMIVMIVMWASNSSVWQVTTMSVLGVTGLTEIAIGIIMVATSR